MKMNPDLDSPAAPSDSRWLPVTFRDTALSSFETALEDAARILDAALAILTQGEGLLQTLTIETYTRRVPVVFHACIGRHYRHCLDHFTSLMRGLDADAVDYDHREREVRIESLPDRTEANSGDALTTRTAPTQRARHERCEVSYAHGDSPVTHSTVGRELVYCIAHAIHHFAFQ